jgi:hypothetical protein
VKGGVGHQVPGPTVLVIQLGLCRSVKFSANTLRSRIQLKFSLLVIGEHTTRKIDILWLWIWCSETMDHPHVSTECPPCVQCVIGIRDCLSVKFYNHTWASPWLPLAFGLTQMSSEICWSWLAHLLPWSVWDAFTQNNPEASRACLGSNLLWKGF